METNTCHGQCYLMQKLKKQQEKEQQSFKINLQEGLAVDHQEFSLKSPSVFPQRNDNYNLYNSALNPQDYIGTIDRPPLLG